MRAVKNRCDIYGKEIGLSIYRTSKLPEMEQMAVEVEDYEAAAAIRDERQLRRSSDLVASLKKPMARSLNKR